jgi:hypothetical protein
MFNPYKKILIAHNSLVGPATSWDQQTHWFAWGKAISPFFFFYFTPSVLTSFFLFGKSRRLQN